MEKSEKPKREMRQILPVQGLWTISDLAIYLDMKAADVQEKLAGAGVKTYHFGREYKKRLFRLEDLK